MEPVKFAYVPKRNLQPEFIERRMTIPEPKPSTAVLREVLKGCGFKPGISCSGHGMLSWEERISVRFGFESHQKNVRKVSSVG